MTQPYDQRAYALSAACDELEELGPLAIARPNDRGAWDIIVSAPDGAVLVAPFTLDPMSDGAFPPNAAGHRLIERGWMPRPCAHHAPDRVAGWKPNADTPGEWSTPATKAI